MRPFIPFTPEQLQEDEFLDQATVGNTQLTTERPVSGEGFELLVAALVKQFPRAQPYLVRKPESPADERLHPASCRIIDTRGMAPDYRNYDKAIVVRNALLNLVRDPDAPLRRTMTIRLGSVVLLEGARRGDPQEGWLVGAVPISRDLEKIGRQQKSVCHALGFDPKAATVHVPLIFVGMNDHPNSRSVAIQARDLVSMRIKSRDGPPFTCTLLPSEYSTERRRSYT